MKVDKMDVKDEIQYLLKMVNDVAVKNGETVLPINTSRKGSSQT